MPNTNWEQVKELLDEVLQIEPSKRLTYLRKAAVNDEVRAEVESLIAFEDEAENLMNLSAIEFSKDFFTEEDDSSALLGQQIGVYRIIREIGYGGLGAVYLAERNDGKFEQKVALKLLKREFNTARLHQSFKGFF
jgi:eukaryotic-like serine/threonine-protein kinase